MEDRDILSTSLSFKRLCNAVGRVLKVKFCRLEYEIRLIKLLLKLNVINGRNNILKIIFFSLILH